MGRARTASSTAPRPQQLPSPRPTGQAVTLLEHLQVFHLLSAAETEGEHLLYYFVTVFEIWLVLKPLWVSKGKAYLFLSNRVWLAV